MFYIQQSLPLILKQAFAAYSIYYTELETCLHECYVLDERRALIDDFTDLKITQARFIPVMHCPASTATISFDRQVLLLSLRKW